ncbi:MAG: hypothetical protein K9I82_17220 [Chitinophagaceae bacterium]|nr:hypothetical protein [Chitinophagaceae bacterium]
MKNFLMYFGITILIISCSSNKINDAKEEINYYKLNKIKRVEKYQYDYKFGVVDSSTKELEMAFEYDTLGNEIKSIYYYKQYSLTVDTSDGTLMDSMYTIKTYNKNGNVISTISYDEVGKINYKTTTTYNENNKIIDYIQYDANGALEYKNHNTFDNNGYWISSTSNDLKKNSVKITTVVKRDGDIEKEVKETDDKSNLIERYVLKVHNDSISIYENYDSLNTLYSRIESKLYKKIIIGSKSINLKNNLTNYEYRKKLNEMNLPIEEISYTEGEPSIFYKYVYYKF